MFRSESIELFIEDQAFSPSYDLAPPPPPSPVSKLSLFLSLPMYRRSSLLAGEGGIGGKRRIQINDGEKACYFKIHSTLSPASHT